MKDSVTYQAIVEEGKIQARQEVFFQQGRKKFGGPSKAVELTLRGITDLDRLVYLNERLLDVSTWEDLLATP